MAAVEETGPRKDGRGDDGEAAADPTWSGRLKERAPSAQQSSLSRSRSLITWWGPFTLGLGAV